MSGFGKYLKEMLIKWTVDTSSVKAGAQQVVTATKSANTQIIADAEATAARLTAIDRRTATVRQEIYQATANAAAAANAQAFAQANYVNNPSRMNPASQNPAQAGTAAGRGSMTGAAAAGSAQALYQANAAGTPPINWASGTPGQSTPSGVINATTAANNAAMSSAQSLYASNAAMAASADEAYRRTQAATTATESATAAMRTQERVLTSMATAYQRAGMALSMFLTLPLLMLYKASVQAAEQMTRYRAGLTATMGSAELAGDQLMRLEKIAKLPGLNYRDLIEGSLMLQNAGMSAMGAERSIRAFGNALAVAGKGKEALDGVQLALMQILTKGKLVGQELRQLQERLPQIRTATQKAFGTADTKQLISMGIGAHEYVRGVTEELEKLPQMSDNFSNVMKNFTDSAFRFRAAIGEALAPALTDLMENLEGFMGVFRQMSPTAQRVTVDISLLAASAGPLALLLGMIMKLQVSMIAWRREMELTTGAAVTMGQAVKASLLGRAGTGLGLAAGGMILGDLIGGDENATSGPEYLKKLFRNAAQAGGLGAAAGFMVGGPWGALAVGAGSAIGAAAAEGLRNRRSGEVPSSSEGTMFSHNDISGRMGAAAEEADKNAEIEREARWKRWDIEQTKGLDDLTAKQRSAYLTYHKTIQELEHAQYEAAENVKVVDARYREYIQYDKEAQNNKKLMTKEMKAQRRERLQELGDELKVAEAELRATENVERKKLAYAEYMSVIREVQKQKRDKDLKNMEIERDASRKASLGQAVLGQNEINTQRITAYYTYLNTMEELRRLYEKGERVTQRAQLAYVEYMTAMHTFRDMERKEHEQEKSASDQASAMLLTIGQTPLMQREITARAQYFKVVEDLTREYHEGHAVEGRLALAKAEYWVTHSELMKQYQEEQQKKQLAAYGYEAEAEAIRLDIAGKDDEAARLRAESKLAQASTPDATVEQRTLAFAEYNKTLWELQKKKQEEDDKNTNKYLDNVWRRIEANRRESDRYTEDQERQKQALIDKEKASIQLLSDGEDLWRQGAVAGAQMRLNVPPSSFTPTDRGQPPTEWEMIQALQQIAAETATQTEIMKQLKRAYEGQPQAAY